MGRGRIGALDRPEDGMQERWDRGGQDQWHSASNRLMQNLLLVLEISTNCAKSGIPTVRWAFTTLHFLSLGFYTLVAKPS